VAGGANFPDGGAPWTGSAKKWYDQIFVLEKPEGEWKRAGKLPRPLGYGVSVSWRDALLCFGGSNEHGHYADAFMVRYRKGKVYIENLPNLPAPLANACGALVGNVVYIAGGIKTPDSKSTENSFWSLDLSRPRSAWQWQVLPSWPGPSRMLSVAGMHEEAFYLFSGARLEEGQRAYLKDAYRFKPSTGWERLADLPTPAVAAPATAYHNGKDQLYIFGGDDGKYAPVASQLKEKHPGFSTDILSYYPALDWWCREGSIFTKKNVDADKEPNESIWAPVTTCMVVWKGLVVFPGGEVRPATRTPRVLMARPAPCQHQ
jgi:N-acetylneuraminic acid mutarotase